MGADVVGWWVMDVGEQKMLWLEVGLRVTFYTHHRHFPRPQFRASEIPKFFNITQHYRK